MEIKIHSVHFTADQKLKDFTSKKIEKLKQFSDKIITSEVFYRLDNTSANENKIAEIKLDVSGRECFAKKQAKSFEEAVDLSVEALRRQLRKIKGKDLDNKK